MKTLKRRAFLPGVPNHIYQITKDCGLLFYDEEDCLVCFTTLCVSARKRNVVISALCFMLTHIHKQVTSVLKKDFIDFETENTSRFTVEYNKKYGKKGQLFKSPFGSAPKNGRFLRQDNLAYILNNPVVKYICTHAIKYRWNFLAYAFSDHPFSEKYLKTRATKELNRAMAMVDWLHRNGKAISYEFCRSQRSILSEKEWKQLSDYIVVKYNVLDYSWIEELYGTREELLTALENTRGKEPDLEEEPECRSYKSYYNMLRLLKTEDLTRKYPGFPFNLEERHLHFLIRFFASRTKAFSHEIASFLHVPVEQVKEILKTSRYWKSAPQDA